MANGNGETVIKIIGGVIVALSMAALGNGLLLWRDHSTLEQKVDTFQSNTFELEKRLLLIEHAQLSTRIAVNESDIERLETELRSRQ